MANQSLSERQEDEIQALLAIFMEDATDLRESDAWKIQRPPEIKLTLRPQESMGNANQTAYVQVDLIIKCSCNYPDEPPDFRLENPKGLSNNQLATLKESLVSLSRQLVGEVMIHELANHVQGFLHENNKPPTMSFYEEMMFNKRKQEEVIAKEQLKKMELQRRKEERERQNIEDEIMRKQTALRIEIKKRKDEDNNRNSNNSVISDPATPSSDAPGCSPITPMSPVIGRSERRSSESPVSSKENPLLNGLARRQRRTSTPKRTTDDVNNRYRNHSGGVIVLAFSTKGERTVQRGMCLDHNSNGSMLYAGMDTSSGSLVTICEWVLKWRHFTNKKNQDNMEEDKDASIYMKHVHSIEQELHSLIRLHHPHLVNYLAMRYQQESFKITVHILMEYAGGNTLDNYLRKSQPLPLELLRTYTDELLLAVEYLHNKAVVHKDLRASSVFVDHSGKIRLADFSINKRLSDLYETIEKTRPGVRFQDNRASVLGRGGKKADIFQLGQLVLSLAEGDRVLDVQPIIPTTFPPQLHDFLTKCLIQDERHRWSASQLLDHAFLKEPVPGTIHLKSPDQDNLHKESNQIDKKNDDDDDDDDDGEGLPYVHVTALEATGQSRLTSEFQILKSLGKGGFGEVIKVKNKLDGRMYAIKRIPLNPKSKQFNKKITREVKLLSRLNHENVVRYYNSWIEMSEEPAESDSSSSCTPKTTDSDHKKSSGKVDNRTDSWGVMDDIEKDAPQAVEGSVEWSISVAFDTACQKALASDSEDEDEDETDVFGKSFLAVLDTSESVVFGTIPGEDGQAVTETEMDSKKQLKQDTTTNTQETFPEIVPKLQYLYIQMEYCEKSTLRNCIDAGLYEDVTRVWRLFREIVEGLIHIHEQGMIHRDLKPVNIFLDSNDHVKIGDFGLATTDIAKSGLLDVSLPAAAYSDYNLMSFSRSGSLGDGNLTGKVGTALYVSPEVMTGGTKLHYNQKVDIYSLGIIFFEMCYKPLPTGMERVQILSSLRMATVTLPDDFDEIDKANQAKLIRWLLNHDPSQRPTSKELLQSDYVPPPQMEEAELNEILRSTISNPQSRAYRRMIEAVFSQQVLPAADYSYDIDTHSKNVFSLKSSQISTHVYDTLEKVFQLHGAVKMATPFLMPQLDLYQDVDQYVRLMDHSGGLVGLPYDLRVPFARYIARSNILFMKRYCLDRVFREKRFFALHPKEMTECAFDIVTPTQGSLIPDAEVLVLVQHCITEFPPLLAHSYCVYMNHQSLLRAVLLHCGIPEEKHRHVLTVLSSVQFNKQKRQKALETLTDVTLSEQNLANLTQLLDLKGEYGMVNSVLRIITKTKELASTLAKQGLHEIEAVMTHAVSMGLKLQIVVSVGLIYNPLQYSGIVFQVMREVKMKKQNAVEVIAAGGRYDKMIRQFMKPLHNVSHTPTAVGVSIGFDRIVAAVWEETETPGPYDILVCTIGCKPMLKERLAVVKELWATGLKTEVLYETKQSLEEISDYCRGMGISHLVILKDTDTNTVKVRSYEKEKVTERKVQVSDLVDFLQQKLDWVDTIPSYEKKNNPGQSTTYNEMYQSTSSNTSNSNATFNFIFIMQEGRIAFNTKRKYESQIFGKVNTALPWLPGKSHDVIAVELNKLVLSIIAAYLELNGTEADFDASISSVIEKQPRHRKYLTNIIDEIHELKFEKRCQFIILYGLKDDSVKVIS